MKNFTLSLLIFLAGIGFSTAQTIENFESLKIQLQSIVFNEKPSPLGSNSFMVVPNPDPTGINTSPNVLKYIRDKNSPYYDGPYWTLEKPILFDKKYVHFKVWKPVTSGVMFDFYQQNLTGTGHFLSSMNSQTIENGWEEFVIDYSEVTDVMGVFMVSPETNPGELTENITIYIDDITINGNPDLGSAPEMVLEDFEPIPLNLMLGGAEDQSNMTLSPNPDASGVNMSSSVIKFQRDKDGVPWGGFWSALPTAIDVTTNKFMHVKVWKPRISPVKFKIEGGDAGNLEIESKYPQTKINAWEDMVFDFSAKTGAYPKIAFMPDFEDPLNLANDITIYLDDIVLNNDSLPGIPREVVINVDMKYAVLTGGQQVYISGEFGGVYGNWAEAGTIPANEMKDLDGDGIYTITMNLPDGPVEFKFFKGTGSAGGDNGPLNRKYTVNGNANLTYKWQLGGLVMPEPALKEKIFNVDLSEASLTEGQKVYISGTMGGINGNWAEPGTNPENELTDTDGDKIYFIKMNLPSELISFKFFKGSGWDGGEWAGDPNRSYSVNVGATVNFKWGTPGAKGVMDDYNLVKAGYFNTDGDIIPALEVRSDWLGFTNNNGVARIIDGVLTMDPTQMSLFWSLGVYHNLNDVGEMLYNDTTYLFMFDAWAEKDRVFSIDFEDNPGNSYMRFGASPDVDSGDGNTQMVPGWSQWDVSITTNKTTYLRTVTMDKILPNTTFSLRIMPGVDLGTLYVDNIYLIKKQDFLKYGVKVEALTVSGEAGANTITTDKGTLQMSAIFLPEDVWVKDAEWSMVKGTGNAVIDVHGRLTAVADGTVTVKATAKDGSNVSGSVDITISNQMKSGFPIDFETPTDLVWDVFANGTSKASDLTIVSNPKPNTVNRSTHVLKFVVNDAAEIYAGAYSNEFTPIEFTNSMHRIRMMVRKTIESPSGIKVEQSTNGGPVTEIKVSNTLINNWQKLVFDFAACIGYSYPRLVLFPDYPDARTSGTTVFIDNIELVEDPLGVYPDEINPVKVYPNPVVNELNVYLDSEYARLEIFNSLGTKIEEVKARGTHVSIDVSSYLPGVYFIKIDGEKVVKFVK